MWLNKEKVTDFALSTYRASLLNSCPNHVVIDGLFDETKLDAVMQLLRNSSLWKTQRHTYSALYVDNTQWDKTTTDQRFVQRDVWQRQTPIADAFNMTIADQFLAFLRQDEFMDLLSRIFNVALTDLNVADPEINTNYFRLSAADFVEQHADDSPGREVCMLIYLNKEWQPDAGGELVFIGQDDKPVCVPPLYNRCVLFDPSSKGSEHWVKQLSSKYTGEFRYNITSWYWSK